MNPFLHQQQFLEVLDRDEAERRFRHHLDLSPLASETVDLSEALGRVLSEDVIAPVDVPGFDRSNVDGFAVRAEDLYGAAEEERRELRLNAETIPTGYRPTLEVVPGTATPIATGAILPRGANAVVMIEQTEVDGETLRVNRAVSPGGNVSFAGSDIGCGELILTRGQKLTSRETGVLAALGIRRVEVVRRPRVAIISTGDELIEPGQTLRPGQIFDSNATVLSDSVREMGGVPIPLGIVADDLDALRTVFARALEADVILLSGGTSKGAGDISYRVVGEFGGPGIVAHGVALKPGKPLCLAVIQSPPPRPDGVRRRPLPVAVLPGFPTSAIFTFQEFLAPVIRLFAGRSSIPRRVVKATLPMRVNSERGRTEYLLVGLIPTADSPGYLAFPMGKGSGSVTTFSKADGFIAIARQREYLEAGETVDVTLLGDGIEAAELVVIGSHCTGLDYLLSRLRDRGIRSKFIAVGSQGGLDAVRRGECDLAGVHLLDAASGAYNRPFLKPGMQLLPGYRRQQGILYRPGDSRFIGKNAAELIREVCRREDCILANRNRGSGTRVLLDSLLGGVKPNGYLTEFRSHQAVAAAVAQGRADWGVAILQAAESYRLGFVSLREEEYDFVCPESRAERPAVRAFRELLEEAGTKQELEKRGFRLV